MAFLAREIAADELVGAIAEEAALADHDLDAIEERLARIGASPDENAALALTLGRAGRASSARALGAARARVAGTIEAKAIGVAIELCSIDPPRWLERAEVGYRRVDPITTEELFIEDPLAAHWHHRNRWGPPLRVDHTCPVFDAVTARSTEELVTRVREGAIALVTFDAHTIFPTLHPALRLTRAGLTHDPSLRHLIRWTAVRSIGSIDRRFAKHAAYEVHGAPVVLPAKPAMGTAALIEAMSALASAARR